MTTSQKVPTHWRISSDVVMTSQCGPRRPNLNETKMRRCYDVECRVGLVMKKGVPINQINQNLQKIPVKKLILLKN